MAETRSGVLRWVETGGGGHRLVVEDGANRRKVTQAERQLVEELRNRPWAELDGVAVDFEWHSGQLRAVRPAGMPPPPRTSVTPVRAARGSGAQERGVAEPDVGSSGPRGRTGATPASASTRNSGIRDSDSRGPAAGEPFGRHSGGWERAARETEARATRPPTRPSPFRPSGVGGHHPDSAPGARPGWVRPTGSHDNHDNAERSSTPSQVDVFHNPYTFVPALARGKGVVPEGREGLGDGEPAGHDTLYGDAWTGRLAVRLTTITPLLVLDTAPVKPDSTGHGTYHPLVRGDRPHLPSTSVKGMLRAAYEAVTNSRLGIFTGHDTPLGYRMSARAGLDMVPARISDDGKHVELFTGTSRLGQRPSSQAVMYAAWLPRYGGPWKKVTYSDGTEPEHRQPARVRLRLVQHHRWDRGRQEHVPDFRYWVVTDITRPGEPLSSARQTGGSRKTPKFSYHEELDETREADGWVFVSNQNFSRKHDERVFFGTPQLRSLTDEVRTAWTNLVEDYRNAHRHADIWERKGRPVDERGRVVDRRGRADRPGGRPSAAGNELGGLAKPWDYLGREPGKTAWSSHQYVEGAEILKPGDLCYARLDSRGNLEALFPVMIARELHAASPTELLHPSLRPASTRGELSPADRVFGWVNPGGHGAYRGQLRVGPVRCDQTATDAVERFGGQGLPLAILGQPKPQQGRFYVAGGTSSRPEPLADKAPRRDWYVPGRSLRGRKTYPHHAGLPGDYWNDPTEDRTQKPDDGRYQEYRRPNKPVEQTDRRAGNQPVLTDDGRAFATTGDGPKHEVRDDQNRSVTGWVKPETTFQFDLDVRNLSDVELGALLWLLTLPDRHYHRLGFGKPLGFGRSTSMSTGRPASCAVVATGRHTTGRLPPLLDRSTVMGRTRRRSSPHL